MADLPNLKALMTSHHAPTIQDGSREMFHLSGGDLFALVDPSNKVVGFHTKTPGISANRRSNCWTVVARWTNPCSGGSPGGHLYEVVLAPIYFGPRSDNALLGVVAVGYEMNSRRGAAGQPGGGQPSGDRVRRRVVVSTLNPEQTTELAQPSDAASPLRPIRRTGSWERKASWFRR